jgi:hypothetical protein
MVSKKSEQITKSSEKEIIIKHPLPRSEWRRMVLLKNTANMMSSKNDNVFNTSVEMLEETRTTRIICKNVDDFELRKIKEAVKEATDSSYKSWFKNPFKKQKTQN